MSDPTAGVPPEVAIAADLRPFVAARYGYSMQGVPTSVHRGLPSVSLAMVLPIGRPLRTARSWRDWAAGRLDTNRTVLGGLHTRVVPVELLEHSCGIQLALDPIGVRRLFGIPASALPTDQFDVGELLGDEIDRLADELAGIADWAGRYAAVDHFLRRSLAGTDAATAVKPEVARAWTLLARGRGKAQVEQISRDVGYSRKRLTDLFRAELGITPRMAGRLARFDAARATLAGRVRRDRSATGLDLAGLAADHGYFDHAHLVRDFHDFAGLSPSAWVAAEFPNIQAARPAGPAE
ncbi:AraC family transcriptional regulator [Skermania piniformis]|uniref:Helix-turn-helix domain-containing protein n=1 Tax=Skermania pinensis TaxID=39122 RepID=A0ABX8S6W0_9ACTN|nr:helix-turn-helix domain-containing protein [Skermania piniformis]QXQ12996.1 helix-turn-helix domain-containing protein [Skermania piniformis]